MITILSGSDEHTLGIEVRGRLTEKDYATIKSEIDLRTGDNGDAVSLVLDIEGVEGVTMKAVLEDLSMIGYADKIDKMATVTESGPWELAAEAIGKPMGELMGIDVKHFEPSATDAAWSWARA